MRKVKQLPRRRFLSALLAVLGLGLVAVGLRQQWQKHSVKKTAERFMVAVLKGDRAELLQCVDPNSAAVKRIQSNPSLWTPSPGFAFRTLKVHIEGDQATVHMRLKQLGFYAEPVIKLKRTADGWKVTSVEHYRFHRVSRGRNEFSQTNADLELATTLKTALEASSSTADVEKQAVPTHAQKPSTTQ